MRLYDNQPSGTLDRARELRRNASEPEKRLLRGLRGAFPQLKWRHQTPVGPFYADILCFSEKLVVEVDGDTHAGAEAYDRARTAYLSREGYRVLRFHNADVMLNLSGMLEQISLSFQEREGGPQGRKGEDRTGTISQAEAPALSSPARGYAAPPLSQRERGSEGHR